MGLREDLEKAGDKLKKVGDNIKDTVDEARHRSAVEAEREDRELNEGAMTPGEQLGSVGREAKHEVLADVDQTKRTIRNNT